MHLWLWVVTKIWRNCHTVSLKSIQMIESYIHVNSLDIENIFWHKIPLNSLSGKVPTYSSQKGLNTHKCNSTTKSHNILTSYTVFSKYYLPPVQRWETIWIHFKLLWNSARLETSIHQVNVSINIAPNVTSVLVVLLRKKSMYVYFHWF